MLRQEEIALFPLQIILYPTISSRMQIFEQRYLRLVKESMANSKPFGILPIVGGREVGATPEVFPWGTLVTIRDFEQQPNGLLSIVVQGEQRVHIGATRVEEDGLMFGDAEIFAVDNDEPIGFAEDDLVDMLESLASHMGIDKSLFLADLTRATLVWRLAGVLPVDPERKRSLLAMATVDERLLEIKKWVIELRMRGARPAP
jgi:Lon protease-like protein